MAIELFNRKLSVDGYMQRIGYGGSLKTDEETLFAIHEAHSYTVPYENLEIMERKPLTLDIESLYNKIVVRRRGGYCFELNGLFSWLLDTLGFKPVEYFGRWLWGEPRKIPLKRHRISKVVLDGVPYICDVGVGVPTYVRPLVFETGRVQEQCGIAFRIVRDDTFGFVVQRATKEKDWEQLFSFTEERVYPIDFYYVHYWCTTHPDSIFLNNTMVHMPTKYGRNTAADIFDPVAGIKVREFRSTMPDGSVARYIPRTREEFAGTLKELFGIDEYCGG